MYMDLHLICFNFRDMLATLIFSQDPILDLEVRKNNAD